MMNHTPIESAGAAKGSHKTYATGFVLSVILTVLSFALVMSGLFPRSAVLIGILGAAIVQILVHLHYFLHLDTSSEAHWNLMALLFTAFIMALFVGGSIWIMFSLRYRMM